MQLVITDANIFIDLYEIGLLPSFFKLPFKFHSTTYILAELESDCASHVEKECELFEINSSQKNQMDKLSWNKGFTFPDKSILFIAKKNSFTVLSGEKKMKTWCEKNNLDSHGVLYVMEQLIDYNIHDSEFVADKLIELLDFNQWLPSEICLALIEKWKR